jgi:CDP-diacylglycerol---glycerol-3-phosphate 3-phosphatidyltransferase
MASIYLLKGRFQNLLRPLVSSLARLGVTANQVTIATLLLCLGAGYWVWSREDLRWFWLLPLLYFVRMALNAMDGMLAKEHGQATPLGAVLNEAADLAADIAVYWPFVKLASFKIWTASMAAAWATEIAGLYPLSQGGSRRYDGPMGKSDRAFWFGAAAIFWTWAEPIIASIALLCVATIWNRLRKSPLSRNPT